MREFGQDVKWGVDFGAAFSQEFSVRTGETAANIATLGGYGGVKKAYNEGRVTSTDFWSAGRAYAEGVYSTVTLGGGERAVDAYAEGKGAGGIALEATKGVGETLLPINEVKTLADPDKNAWEKAEAFAMGTAKVAGLAVGGLAAKNAIAQRLANKPGLVTESAAGADAAMAPAEGALPPRVAAPGGRTANFAGKQRFDATQLSAEQADTAILKSIRRRSGATGTPSGQIAADSEQTQFIIEKTTAWRRNVHATEPEYASLRALSPQQKGTALHSLCRIDCVR